MKMKILNFLSKIATACRIWSQKLQSFLIIKMAVFWKTEYLITWILSGTLINANLGHSTLIYLAIINVVLIYIHMEKWNWTVWIYV